MKQIKYKYVIVLVIIAIVIWIYGMLQKILHYANADLMFKISFGLFILSALLIIIKILSNKDKNDFINK